MRRYGLPCLCLILALAGCGPRIEGSIALTRVVTIRNADTTPFTVTRIVANGNESDGNCIDRPNQTLAPGESYTTTFVICGAVASVSVETDRGSTTLR